MSTPGLIDTSHSGQAPEHLSAPGLMDTGTGANGYAPLGRAPEHIWTLGLTPGLTHTPLIGQVPGSPLGQAPEHLSTPGPMDIDTGGNGYAPWARHRSTSVPWD